jgi:mannose-6-phosphate isomerase-like protein (cupin superfamily)
MDVVDSETADRAVPSVELLPVQFDGRRVGVLSVASPGVRDEWEMHPEQDELLYLLKGAIDLFLRPDLESGDDESVLHIRHGEACVVPKGIWHRQEVVDPCSILFLTPETLHRRFDPSAGWSD